MDLNHLHLHVRDLARARAFYERWFGFRERVRHGDILFLANAQGFDLALAPAPKPGVFPRWFHFGSRLPSAGKVKALHARMTSSGAAGVGVLGEEEDFVFFRCKDPDGHAIEVYWEP